MGRPWLIQFGPFLIPTEAREELNTIATGMSAKDYVDNLWELRNANYPRRMKARSKAWPATKRVKGSGYRLNPKPKAISALETPAPQGSRPSLSAQQ